MDSIIGDKTVVVLPGGLARADAAFRWIDRLAVRYRVITIAYPTTISRIEALCQSFWALCDRLQLDIHLLSGGSFSGLVAQWLVRFRPQRIQAMVLSDTGVPSWRRALWFAPLRPLLHLLPLPLVRRLFRLGVQSFVADMEHERGIFWQRYFDTAIAQLSRSACLNLHSLWLQMDCVNVSSWESAWQGRVLLINATNDALFSSKEQSVLRRLYPQAIVHSFDGHTHAASLDLLDETISLVTAWLEAE